MGEPHGIGIVGLGVISEKYLTTLESHPRVRIVAVADLDAERTAAAARRTGAAAESVDGLLAHPAVDTVLDLTVPAAHAEISLRAIAAGKHVYGEKPLTAGLDDGRRVIEAASRAGVRVGCAPDTVLGTGVQTARAAVESGLIGRPTAASASWHAPGHEHWHPSPEFYYREGGGPLFDMGPYYLSSLVHLLGPVASVIGASSRPRTNRVVATGPRAGAVIDVEVDTHVTGVLTHAGGALSTVTMSFDGPHSVAPPIEVHGELGSLVVPDPNRFAGDVLLTPLGEREPRLLPPSAGYAEAERGIGLLDFVAGPGRASGALGLHVLEIMTALLDSARTGARVPVASSPAIPPLVPLTPAATWRAGPA